MRYPHPMGHRKKRKQERRQRLDPGRDGGSGLQLATFDPAGFDPYSASDSETDFFMAFSRQAQSTAKVCGGCKEFVEDAEGGRGTCLHPGSGILSPWTDTKGCDFFAARRGASSRPR